jgi:hypothetical protein
MLTILSLVLSLSHLLHAQHTDDEAAIKKVIKDETDAYFEGNVDKLLAKSAFDKVLKLCQRCIAGATAWATYTQDIIKENEPT